MRALTTLAAMSIFSAGCLAYAPPGPTPVGPGAATTADLRPWLAKAPTITRTGRLTQFSVQSQFGQYVTWALVPRDTSLSAELDVRSCAEEVELLRDQIVLVRGKLLERGPRHRPLLVVDAIVPIPGQHRDAHFTRRHPRWAVI